MLETIPAYRGGRRLSGIVLPVALAALLSFASVPALAQDPGLALLHQELDRIGELSGGVMGFSAIHLESGREVHLNPDEAFPMASTYKVPIAVRLFQQVDRGELSLDDMVTLEPHHYGPGSGILSDLFIQPGVSLSLRNLTELMLLISDNSATDLVLEAAGGGVAVTDAMRSLGFPGIRVDRPTLNLIADYIGIEGLPAREALTLERYREIVEAVPPHTREAAATTFHLDGRDAASPREMAGLLAGIWEDHFLSAEMSALLRDIMERCRTGGNRIRGMIPPYVTTANKTGTIGGTLNDVGAIELPDGGGWIVVVGFIKDSTAPNTQREAAIAHASRAVYDYFNLNR